jgi:hypothetical protein
VRLLHAAVKTDAHFDDPNLVSHAGLVPAMRLAERMGLERLVAERVHVDAPVGANAALKVGSLIAGMIAGADAIDGMDTLRHGAIPTTFGGIRAPSTLGSFLRALTYGNVRQLGAVHRAVLSARPPPRRCCQAGSSWRSSTSTRHKNGCSGPPSRARRSDTPRSHRSR